VPDTGVAVPEEDKRPINTHALEEIKAYLAHHAPRRPKANVESSELFVFGAWRWLRPESSLERLSKLQEDARLSELDTGEFARRLLEACEELEENHPKLRLWIAKRCALLEYRTSTLAELPTELPTTGISLNHSLFTGLMNYCDAGSPLTREQAVSALERAAAETLEQAMEAVGQIVCRTLSIRPNECRFWANLMLPEEFDFLASPLFSAFDSQQNIEDARELWGDPVKYEKCLVVVAETNDKVEYLGFWIPVLPNCRNPSAGAATAYYKARASAVFIDDPPPLGDDVSDGTHPKWVRYLRERFLQAVFVSVPFAIEVKGGQKKVPAIVNVNIDPANDRDFRRAYYPEWLRIIQREAAPLVCEAHKAFVLSRATLR
jgi:hypothetical protein